ncbi:MAG: NlpC/P60 family protein, partial [Candidatus Liptonbacteria bacterium]|nr:NlpC/P60 family protein [Candidatus Liptonbacteria bacterium]
MVRTLGVIMEYRAVGNRCAVDLQSLRLPISHGEILELLRKKEFGLIEVDLVGLARDCIGASKYRRGARLRDAPAIVDCSSFIKWLYGKRGIWLPRRSIQQRELGQVVAPDDIIAGDVVFISGRIDYHLDDPADGVGHVGIATGDKTVIHAANKKSGVIETPLGEFIERVKFRGARRYVAKDRVVSTFELPDGREIETA